MIYIILLQMFSMDKLLVYIFLSLGTLNNVFNKRHMLAITIQIRYGNRSISTNNVWDCYKQKKNPKRYNKPKAKASLAVLVITVHITHIPRITYVCYFYLKSYYKVSSNSGFLISSFLTQTSVTLKLKWSKVFEKDKYSNISWFICFSCNDAQSMYQMGDSSYSEML